MARKCPAREIVMPHSHVVKMGSEEEGIVPIGIGERLRAIRQQWQLSLREVEERSFRFAQESGDRSYRVSASWLVRLECEDHDLTVHKLIALADIYNTPVKELLRSSYPVSSQSILKRLSSPIPPMLLADRSLEKNANGLIPNTRLVEPPYRTRLLPLAGGSLQETNKRGVIGRRDRTLEPMVPPGSIVCIDTRKRAISLQKNWTHEFQRPIYFLMTPEGYVCGWCELDEDSQWLTVIPHPLSPASSRTWKYQTEIETLGRVVAVAIRLAE
jgi:transcriptional regulator with XRE-family HTH domain